MTFIGRVRHIRIASQVDEGGEGGRFLRKDHLFHTPVSHQAMMILAILGFGDIYKRCIIVLKYHCYAAALDYLKRVWNFLAITFTPCHRNKSLWITAREVIL
jgi:hypothetical protein